MSAQTSLPAESTSPISRLIRDIASQMGIDEDVLHRLMEPKECIRLRLSPQLRDGRVHNITAFLVRHSDILGPAKGGIRMSSLADESMTRTLALEMTLKTALIDIPFGGGKSCIRIDPMGLHLDDKEIIIRSFVNRALRHIGPEIYIPAPDMGTGEQEMGYIKDSIAYGSGQATTRGCYVTGKPLILGGIPGRRNATGYGVVITLRELAKRRGLDLASARVVIQGYGNVGSVVAKKLADLGATVLAVSDVRGAIYAPHGIDIVSLEQYVEASGTVVNFSGAKAIKGDQIYNLECDVFVPAAIGDVLDRERATQIRASIVAEAANGPTTPEGDRVLNERGIDVIPDILCNAGGVFVSYLEYTQETQRDQWTLEDVNNRLERRMAKRFDEVWNLAERDNSTLRAAAIKLALERLMSGMRSRGFLS